MAKRQASVLELCIARVGVHRGALAASYVARYAMTMHRLHKFPTTVEYADDWALDERTAWRHREKMRDALGDSWQEVITHCSAYIDERSSVKSLQRLPIPTKLVAA